MSTQPRGREHISLDQWISVAEHNMVRLGLNGRTLTIPTGRHDDPAYRAAIKPVEDWAADVMGQRMLGRIYHSAYTLRAAGDPVAMTTGLGGIVVRETTDELTILHECAHLMEHEESRHGHGWEFAARARDLYRKHLGDKAADVFWDWVSLAEKVTP